MKKIENPDGFIVAEFDGVTDCGIYLGGLARLKRVNKDLKWRIDKDLAVMCECDGKILTLSEIAEQLKGRGYGVITVITISPLSGIVLQFGNYGEEWWEIGKLDGYA